MVDTEHNLKKLGFEARFVPGACGFSYYTREANESFPSKKKTNEKGSGKARRTSCIGSFLGGGCPL